MFYYVSGTVAEIGPNLAVIDCGGVGYACATTNYTISRLKKGERAKLFTYLHVREEIFELFGFSSQQELSSFKMLIGVSGVGPKAALAILSSTTPNNLALSIVTGDEKALTAAPGIRRTRPGHRLGRREQGGRGVGGAGRPRVRYAGDRRGAQGRRHGAAA